MNIKLIYFNIHLAWYHTRYIIIISILNTVITISGEWVLHHTWELLWVLLEKTLRRFSNVLTFATFKLSTTQLKCLNLLIVSVYCSLNLKYKIGYSFALDYHWSILCYFCTNILVHYKIYFFKFWLLFVNFKFIKLCQKLKTTLTVRLWGN